MYSEILNQTNTRADIIIPFSICSRLPLSLTRLFLSLSHFFYNKEFLIFQIRKMPNNNVMDCYAHACVFVWQCERHLYTECVRESE